MSQHTPGPWATHGSGNCPCGMVFGPDGNVLVHHAVTHEWADFIPVEAQQIANARLIAAAPELLEACKALLALYQANGMPNSGGSYEMAKAAIAKAEGK